MAALAAIVILPQTEWREYELVSHRGWHKYSNAYETSEIGYTGLSVTRPDIYNVDVPPDGCQEPISGHPIYQTQWLQDNDARDWLEIGTGH